MQTNRRRFSLWRALLRILSLALLAVAVWIANQQWTQFNQLNSLIPQGSTIAGVPVGGLTRQQAKASLLQAYENPVDLQYGSSLIQVTPKQAGFQLDVDGMLSGLDPSANLSIWAQFWNYLNGERSSPVDIPLKYTFSEDTLSQFLETQVAARYDQPASAASPQYNSVKFYPGQAGKSLDVAAAVPLVKQAFLSRSAQPVTLPTRNQEPLPPDWDNLQILLKQTIIIDGFNGLVGLYLHDLKTGKEIHFAVRPGQELPVDPDVAFTASSIIKIPILVSVFHHLSGPPSGDVANLLDAMIAQSSNDAADALMKTVLDEVRGPLIVTQDMQAIGLKNTFLAGYFALGSPMLETFKTPANQRVDVNTDPDPYSQTTPFDIGQLLVDIYQCAHSGTGPLTTAFGQDMNQTKCQEIIDYLKKDRQPYLITAGLPEGTPIAHKHGYGSFQGIIHTIGDAALVFSPGGDYVLSVYMDNRDLLLWDTANLLIARLSTVVYNYYNVYTDPAFSSLGSALPATH
jgi:beta-lactamase class A